MNEEELKIEQEIWDRIGSTCYWYDCEECEFQTEYYMKQYDHKKITGHKIRIKGATLDYIARVIESGTIRS